MIVGPMVFGVVMHGIAGAGELWKVRRVGGEAPGLLRGHGHHRPGCGRSLGWPLRSGSRHQHRPAEAAAWRPWWSQPGKVISIPLGRWRCWTRVRRSTAVSRRNARAGEPLTAHARCVSRQRDLPPVAACAAWVESGGRPTRRPVLLHCNLGRCTARTGPSGLRVQLRIALPTRRGV